jgi:hypothetical protein
MQRSYKVFFFLLIAVPSGISGQNYNNNPYTRFAIGDLINTGFSYNRSMGGSSIGLRPANQINYMNPASYTSQDTLSFLFHAGVSGRRSYLSSNEEKDNSNNLNMDYLAIGFPIARWWKVSFGLAPFSRTQYYFRDYQESQEEIAIEYKGKGGLNEFYFGTSFQLLSFISIGMNANYLFGDLNRERSIDIPDATVASTKITEDYIASDFYYRCGIQIFPSFTTAKEHTHQFILGAIYDFATNIKIDYGSMTTRNFPSQAINPIRDTFNIINDSTTSLKLPMKFGVGLTYNYNNRLMITAEYSRQYFSKGIGLYQYIDLADYSSYRFGVEFVPSPMTDRRRARYFERMHYRLGAHITDSYLVLAGQQIDDIGISVGMGLPWRNPQKLFTNTMFDISYEFGKRGTTDYGLINEYYHIFTVGLVLYDFWFLKPKYD